MRAWRIREHGGPEVLRLEDLPVPDPGAGEVRVRVDAVGLNHLDLWVRRGVPTHAFPLPVTPGCEIAGRIDAAGRGVSRKADERVLLAPGIGCGGCIPCRRDREHLCASYGILGESRDGGCAEYVVVPERQLMAFPDNLGAEEAAALPLVLLTAWHMLVDRARVRPGDWVLIRAGASGVSTLAIQIAKLWGARVIATVTAESKAPAVAVLGADHVVSLAGRELRDEVRRLTRRRGVDIVMDHVGAPTLRDSMSCLDAGGRLVTCGATAGAEVAIDLRHVFFKNLSLLGSTMGGRGELEEALEHVREGRLRPVVDRVFPMEDLASAHRHLEDRRAVGKVVLRGFRS